MVQRTFIEERPDSERNSKGAQTTTEACLNIEKLL